MKTAIIYDKWLERLGGGEVVSCMVAQILSQNNYQVTLVSKNSVSKDIIFDKLGFTLKNVNFITLSREIEIEKISENKDLFINLSFMDYVYGRAKINIYYVQFPTLTTDFKNLLLWLFQKTKIHLLFPNFLKQKIFERLNAGIFFGQKQRMDSYHLFLTHSQYVQKWIKKLWNKEAVVLYPPIKISNDQYLIFNENQGISFKKNNWICSVGRFFTSGHNKKQDFMIRVFKKLYDLGFQNWELHLIGGIAENEKSHLYIKSLKKMSENYPIFFHINVNKNKVCEILARGKIYWHSTGFGENKERKPMNLEHFGIAPLEAIFYHNYPVLFNGGGLKEIIYKLELDPALCLFSSEKELISKTRSIIEKDPALDWPKISEMIIQVFGEERYGKELLSIVK